MKNDNYRLQFITHHTDSHSYIDSARLALEGGCRWVQLRMKGAERGELEETARLVQRMCREHGATFIIDDDVLLAKRIGADGVHLGKEDMPVAEARATLGAEAIIGATVNSFEDIEAHIQGARPDYFGCGPFRFTTTKKRLAPTLGVEGYVESAASGYLAAVAMAAKVLQKPLPEFPRETAIGALGLYISDERIENFQPMNINFSIISPLETRIRKKAEKNLALSNRSLQIIDRMIAEGMV